MTLRSLIHGKKAILSPSVRKGKSNPAAEQEVTRGAQCCAPQTLHSSHSLKMHEQLYQWGLESSQGYTRVSCLSFACWHTSNLSIFHVNRHAGDTKSYSYTSTTKDLLCLTISHEVQLLYFPLPTLSAARDLLPESFNTWAVSCFDPAPHWSNKDLPYF